MITVLFEGGIINQEAFITVEFFSGLNQQAPYLEEQLSLAEDIFCLDTYVEDTWTYQFPKVIDPEGANLVFDIECPGLPFDLFVFDVSNDVVSMLLNKAPLT